MDEKRIINQDYANIINEKKIKAKHPEKYVINFRDENINKREREVYEIPIEFLKYRKDNGRIISDVISYEKSKKTHIDEYTESGQNKLHEFLEKKDEEKRSALINSIKKEGQKEPVIITADGFLINGNRRRMVFLSLREENPEKYGMLKVVILPNIDEPGGAPTIREIELIENRYQLQVEGKSEYTGLDKAITIRKKIERGVTLDDQLLDDPACVDLKRTDKEFKKKKDEIFNDYLLPLERADAYLDALHKSNHYLLIKDKWQAFIDYSSVYKKLSDSSWRMKNNVDEHEIGQIEATIFNIIRKQKVEGISKKLHEIVREIPKMLSNDEAKESLFEMCEISQQLEEKEKYNVDGVMKEDIEQEAIWKQKNKEKIASCLNKAYGYYTKQKVKETPLALLEDSYKKLNHEKMNIDNLEAEDLQNFMRLINKIEVKITELKSNAWDKIRGREQ